MVEIRTVKGTKLVIIDGYEEFLTRIQVDMPERVLSEVKKSDDGAYLTAGYVLNSQRAIIYSPPDVAANKILKDRRTILTRLDPQSLEGHIEVATGGEVLEIFLKMFEWANTIEKMQLQSSLMLYDEHTYSSARTLERTYLLTPALMLGLIPDGTPILERPKS